MKMVDYLEDKNCGSDGNCDSSPREELLVLNNTVENFTEKNRYEAVKKKPDTVFLYFTAATANVLLFSGSCHQVWTSPVLPILRSNNTDINPIGRPITTIETSLLAGLPFLVGLAGSLFIGHIGDIFGRKKTMFFMGLVMLICSFIIAFSNNVYVYIVARCILISNLSGSLVLLPIYLLEICEDHNRGKFGCLMGVALPLGHLFTYSLGSMTTDVKILTLMCGAPLIPYLLSFWIFAPESPVFLAAKGKLKLALNVLKKLRNNKSPQEIEKDCEKIHETVKTKINTDRVRLRDLLRSRVSRKALLLCLIPISTQHLSGVTVIMQFMAPIFNDAGTSLSGNTISIIAGLVKIGIFFVTAMIVEKLGRRPLLLTSGVCTTITLFFMGLYFYLKHINWVHLDFILWLPITALVINLVVYSIGLGPIPMAIMSEMFPARTRAVGISVVITVNGITIFLLNFLFPIIVAKFGVYVCIWFFSICCCIGTFTTYKLIPETKGKSIIEIQELLEQ